MPVCAPHLLVDAVGWQEDLFRCNQQHTLAGRTHCSLLEQQQRTPYPVSLGPALWTPGWQDNCSRVSICQHPLFSLVMLAWIGFISKSQISRGIIYTLGAKATFSDLGKAWYVIYHTAEEWVAYVGCYFIYINLKELIYQITSSARTYGDSCCPRRRANWAY